MTEGMEWGVWRWLTEKKRVRMIADEARAALDELEMKVKAGWESEYKVAYNLFVGQEDAPKPGRRQANSKNKVDPSNADAKILAAVKRVMEADDEAYNAHEDAEEAFAEAERRMSTSMARDAARMALVAYDRHEEAIRKAEALARPK